MSLLSVSDLSVTFRSRGRNVVHAVDELSFDVAPGATVGLVGESGCGKSVTALSVLGLLPSRGVEVSGSVRFDGTELIGLPQSTLRMMRGREISMVFQDPLSSLNPVLTIGRQLTEVLERHRRMTRDQARAEATVLLDMVGIPDPRARLATYPHQMSGGMRQRALIAMALACRPRLLIADEPTTALDVTIQAQILQLLRALVDEQGTALILITHDLGVVAGRTRRVLVMYAGRVVEEAATPELFGRPRHPYSTGLLASIPRVESASRTRLEPIPGRPPDMVSLPSSCRFAARCRYVQDRCRAEDPPLVEIDAGDHRCACFYPVGILA